MAIDPAQLSIVHYPAAALRQKTTPIDKIDDTVKAVAARMIELMHGEEGVGLAAPQVGLPWRMFIARHPTDGDEDRVYINPTVKVNDPAAEAAEEGCLSLPSIRAEILRPKSVTITATGLDGRQFTRTSDQFIARV